MEKGTDAASRARSGEALAGAVAEHLAVAMGEAGTEEFAAPFLDAAQTLGAVQCMVFAYDSDRARCLLARNFVAGAKGRQRALAYLDGWYRQDPLYRAALAVNHRHSHVLRFAEIRDRMGAEYRALFYDSLDLGGKTAILVARGALRIALNLYHQRPDGPTGWEPNLHRRLCALAGQVAAAHFAAGSGPSWPAPLAVLTERERAVCQGILAGRKAETIAGDLGIAPSSVATYRRRAYEKLGISSRAALFALCRS
ncbi:LuxR C-terminal-related transcriptional regulator [Marinibaculum pumilum]|uniref:LuxR C-terminal-related transcriptional regulator n=1 Tax=Marinibaculum pumilum TaxID=1766165 RepID=A0ABV7L7L6_9PROT